MIFALLAIPTSATFFNERCEGCHKFKNEVTCVFYDIYSVVLCEKCLASAGGVWGARCALKARAEGESQ